MLSLEKAINTLLSELYVLHRKVTLLVVGLDKAGKTSSIRGMLRGNRKAIQAT